MACLVNVFKTIFVIKNKDKKENIGNKFGSRFFFLL